MGNSAHRGNRLHLPQPLDRWINTDGKPHPKENALAFATLTLGIVALVVATNADRHIAGSWIGLLGVVVGLYDQMISATRGERWIIITGVIASGLGFALNMANGGLY